MTQRVELDEVEPEQGKKDRATWASTVFDCLQNASTTADAPEICAWSKPADTLLDKRDNMLGSGVGNDTGSMIMAGVVVAVVGVGIYLKKAMYADP